MYTTITNYKKYIAPAAFFLLGVVLTYFVQQKRIETTLNFKKAFQDDLLQVAINADKVNILDDKMIPYMGTCIIKSNCDIDKLAVMGKERYEARNALAVARNKLEPKWEKLKHESIKDNFWLIK